MGVRSATHVSLSTARGARRALEIQESKRVCETMFGPCDAFAYPFGMAEIQSAATRQALLDAGYRVAFLTHSDFITAASDCDMLPRISLPDESMTLSEFEARAGGAGIILRRLKRLVHSEGRTEPETS